MQYSTFVRETDDPLKYCKKDLIHQFEIFQSLFPTYLLYFAEGNPEVSAASAWPEAVTELLSQAQVTAN